MLKTVIVASMLLLSGAAMAQSVGNGDPANANTTDPNSAPWAAAPRARPITGTTGMGRQDVRQEGLDAVGRANTSDPNSAMSGATNAAGQPVNPMADPRSR
jgi:hypothetical protein